MTLKKFKSVGKILKIHKEFWIAVKKSKRSEKNPGGQLNVRHSREKIQRVWKQSRIAGGKNLIKREKFLSVEKKIES